MKLVIGTLVLSVIAALALVSAVQAADGSSDLDTRQRAKIAKAKAKAAGAEAENFNFLSNGNGNGKGAEQPACGSQSIGNVQLNRQAGVGPREIFIFAPDAINIVGPRGCQ